ncbi:hypothetical protein BJ165DRAFT_1598460 [Panaeolus papilionaceus]|nr:hypothetical protein BJ165DRAFT_1598460 [Panaeolus papilionaceus]
MPAHNDVSFSKYTPGNTPNRAGVRLQSACLSSFTGKERGRVLGYGVHFDGTSRREEVDVRDKGIGSERKANRKGTRRDDIQSQPQPHLPVSPQLRRTYSGATQMESREERIRRDEFWQLRRHQSRALGRLRTGEVVDAVRGTFEVVVRSSSFPSSSPSCSSSGSVSSSALGKEVEVEGQDEQEGETLGDVVLRGLYRGCWNLN